MGFQIAGSLWLIPLSASVALYTLTLRRGPKRTNAIPAADERVLIIGASSGVGRALALQYASRGSTKICIVGRRDKELVSVRDECREIASRIRGTGRAGVGDTEAEKKVDDTDQNIFSYAADCSDPSALDQMRSEILMSKSCR